MLRNAFPTAQNRGPSWVKRKGVPDSAATCSMKTKTPPRTPSDTTPGSTRDVLPPFEWWNHCPIPTTVTTVFGDCSSKSWCSAFSIATSRAWFPLDFPMVTGGWTWLRSPTNSQIWSGDSSGKCNECFVTWSPHHVPTEVASIQHWGHRMNVSTWSAWSLRPPHLVSILGRSPWAQRVHRPRNTTLVAWEAMHSCHWEPAGTNSHGSHEGWQIGVTLWWIMFSDAQWWLVSDG